MTRRVPGAVNHLERLLTDGHCVAILQPAVRREGFCPREAGHLAPIGQLVDPKAVSLLWSLHRHRELLTEHVRCRAMIEMAMG